VPKDCADRDGTAGQAAERDSLWVLANPRAGILRGVLLRGPFRPHRLYPHLRPAFFGPLAAVFSAVFFAAFHWPLGTR
jgi:hypothetical protein